MNTFGNLSLYVVGAIMSAYIFGSIFRKAGYSGWLALLMFVPLVNFGVLFWFATTTWPLERAANVDQGKVTVQRFLRLQTTENTAFLGRATIPVWCFGAIIMFVDTRGSRN